MEMDANKFKLSEVHFPSPIFLFINVKDLMNGPREHNSVGRDMHYYMQGPGFEPRTPPYSS